MSLDSLAVSANVHSQGMQSDLGVRHRIEMGKNKIEFFPEQFYGFAGRTLQLAPDASTVGCMFRVSHDYERANATFLGNAIS